MGDRIHHRDGSPRRSMHSRILYLGAIRTGAIPSVEVFETANNDRLMHAVRRDVHLRLVSTSLFQPLPSKVAKANMRNLVPGTATSARTCKS
jgi:hypothetical protein